MGIISSGLSLIVILFSVLVALLAVTFQGNVHKPLFDNKHLHQLTKNVLHLPLEEQFANITAELKKAYPGHIHDDTHWVLNCAGGFKTSMIILHASLTEYVIFWGSAVRTTGMSGRHLGTFHDFLMTGRFRQLKEDQFKPKDYFPGDHIQHGWLRGSLVQLDEDTWMLEHMEGVIPWSVPFGLADSLLSNQDLPTVVMTIARYATLVVRELLQGKI
eukprot:TRINITY_DN3782_c0_g1_i3.p1 TRINITY_DN3782_c0_g1~~TRINITY_DN3782_c0_g1_i3.p1  ORF type:complete len:216 (-),score=51.86 TRINITY_DN3782_c0_g1_i3:96-743(-)